MGHVGGKSWHVSGDGGVELAVDQLLMLDLIPHFSPKINRRLGNLLANK